jgi:hypothetical protein
MDYDPLTLEVAALDKIHEILGRPENKHDGLTTARIAKEIDCAIGYVSNLLKGSTCVIRRKGLKWVLNWHDHDDVKEWQLRRDYLSARFVIYDDGTLVRVGMDQSSISVKSIKPKTKR